MTEDRFDEALRQAARDYNPPPQAPREEMWAAIQGARRGELGRRAAQRDARPRRWIHWGVGIAAALLVGVGLGRLSVRPTPVAMEPPAATPVAPPSPAAVDPEVAYRVATTRYLTQAEALLTSFRSEASGGAPDPALTTWAGDLLSTTRLLLDSPAAEEPRMRVLLEELELVLAQISQLPAAGSRTAPAGEVEIVRDAIEQGGVLPRLRTTIPAGANLADTEEE